MAVPSRLNCLPIHIIGLIGEMVGTLSLGRLFLIGSRQLTQKLRGPLGIKRFRDCDEYGEIYGIGTGFVTKLNGLKSISLLHAHLSHASALQFFLSLPTGVEDISLRGYHCIEAWTLIKNEQELSFDCSTRFPKLRSLSLWNNQYGSTGRCVTEGCSLDEMEFVCFPATLTHLCLGGFVTALDLSRIQHFPVGLQHLELSITKITSLRWISTVPHLRSLKLLEVQEWKAVPYDMEGKHESLTSVAIQFNLRPPSRTQPFGPLSSALKMIESMRSLLPNLPQLQELRLPGIAVPHDFMVPSLRRVACLLEDMAFPSSVTAIEGHLYKSEVPEEFWVKLPSFLRMLHIDVCPTPRQVSLLPSTLTCLWIGDGVLMGAHFKVLPKSLIRLKAGPQKDSSISKLLTLTHRTLRAIHCGPRIYLRAVDESNQLSSFGWANIEGLILTGDVQGLDRYFEEVSLHSTAQGEAHYQFFWKSFFACVQRERTQQTVESTKNSESSELTQIGLDWLLEKGLCVFPRQVGCVGSTWFFLQILDTCRLNILRWALKSLTKVEWSAVAGSSLSILCADSYVSSLDLLHQYGFHIDTESGSERKNTFLMQAVMTGQLSLVAWLLDHVPDAGLRIDLLIFAVWKKKKVKGNVTADMIELLLQRVPASKLVDAGGPISSEVLPGKLFRLIMSASRKKAPHGKTACRFLDWLFDMGLPLTSTDKNGMAVHLSVASVPKNAKARGWLPKDWNLIVSWFLDLQAPMDSATYKSLLAAAVAKNNEELQSTLKRQSIWPTPSTDLPKVKTEAKTVVTKKTTVSRIAKVEKRE